MSSLEDLGEFTREGNKKCRYNECNSWGGGVNGV